MTYAVRRVGLAVGIGIAAALAAGLALAIAQGESVVLWFAYMLDIAGALTIAFAIFSSAPTSARRAIARRYLEQGGDEEARGKPVISDVVLLGAAGVALLALGLIVELAA